MKKQNIVHIEQDFNRDKLVDEALFVGICGLNQCKNNQITTGLVRLEIAKYKLEQAIELIKKKHNV